MKGRVSNKASRHFGVNVRCNRALTAYTVGPCFALILITGHCVNLCITLHTSRALLWKNSESSRSKNVLECNAVTHGRRHILLALVIAWQTGCWAL